MASTQRLSLLDQDALAAATTEGTTYAIPLKCSDLIGHIVAENVHADTTITAKIQHSPDGSNWYDYITFTAIAGTADTEMKLPANAPVFELVRAHVALAGATLLADVSIDLWFKSTA